MLINLSKFFLPTDAQVNCIKNNSKIYIKIDMKTAPTCFGAVTPSSGSTLLVLAKVTVVKIKVKVSHNRPRWAKGFRVG
jgi:hypothetical protein